MGGCVQGVGPGIRVDTVRLMDVCGSWLIQRMVQLVEGVLVEHVVIELGAPLNDMERQSADFTLCLALTHLVLVILLSP